MYGINIELFYFQSVAMLDNHHTRYSLAENELLRKTAESIY